MQYIQEISLDLWQHGYISVNAKQGDQNGRFIRIHLTNNGAEFRAENGETVVFRALKPDGKSVYNPATVEDAGTILACLTDQTLAVDGDVIADISIKRDNDVVSTLNFTINVQRAPLGENIPSTNEFGALTQATADASAASDRANDAAKLIEDMTVSASKVAAGGTPTAKLTKSSGHYNLALGLVTGDKGNKGDKGDAATITIAETVTGKPGDPAKVENVGTATDPKLKFTIPLGNQGPVSSVNGGTGDVVIGTRNLLTNSREMNGDGHVTGDVYLGLPVYHVSSDDIGGAAYYDLGDWSNLEIKPDTDYTISYYCKGSGLARIFLLGAASGRDNQGNVADAGGSILHTIHGDWQLYAATYRTPAAPSGIRLIAARVNASALADCYITPPIMVEGNVPADWSPAPEDIPSMAPVQSVNGVVGAVQIGERNLLLASGEAITKSDYLVATYKFGNEKPIDGETYTIVGSCALGEGRKSFLLYNSGKNVEAGKDTLQSKVDPDEAGFFCKSFMWNVGNSSNTALYIYQLPSALASATTINWVKLVKGNATSFDWSPAPEDKADVPQQFDVKLPASAWASGSQTVKDARFITGDYDWDVDVKGACIPWNGISITAGQMVARADITPTEGMTWTVTRKEVRRDG